MRSTSKHPLDSVESSSNLAALGVFFPKKNLSIFPNCKGGKKKVCSFISFNIHFISICNEVSILLTLETTNTCSKSNMPEYRYSTLDFTSNDLSNIRVSNKILQSLSNSYHNLTSTLSLLNIVF